jgi:hypothetical protein
VFFAMKMVATLVPPRANDAIPQATSTARMDGERSAAANPSRRSRQWPRESARSLCSSRDGIRTMSAIETTNEAALIRYAAEGPAAAVRIPPRSGPMAQLAFSTVWSSAFACGSSSSGTRFGTPA